MPPYKSVVNEPRVFRGLNKPKSGQVVPVFRNGPAYVQIESTVSQSSLTKLALGDYARTCDLDLPL